MSRSFIARSFRGILCVACLGLMGVGQAHGAVVYLGFTDIEVAPNPRTSDFVPDDAIDGNFTTVSHLTASGNGQPTDVFLDLGSPLTTPLVGFRLRKFSRNVDGSVAPAQAIDPMELRFAVTTSTIITPLASRAYTPVSGLVNGFNGDEEYVLDEGNGGIVDVANGKITHEVSPGVVEDADGFYSVTFDPILNATGFRFHFLPSAANIFTHYGVYEFQAITLVPEPAGMALLGVTGLALLGRGRKNATR